MPINLLTNTSSNSTIRSLSAAQKDMNDSLNRISSGLRVATAKDNVAAHAIITKMSTLLAGYTQAIVNTGQAQNMLETANGGLSEMTKVVQRMKILAIQASSSNLSSSDTVKLNAEFQQLMREADRLASSTTFNGKTLLSGQTTTITNRSTLTGQLLGSGTGAGNGIASLQFDNGVTEGAYSLSYASTGTNSGNLTLKNIATGVGETISLNDGPITAGTESYRFVALGASISLNSNFNKGVSFGLDNTVVNTDTVTLGGSGTGVVADNTGSTNNNTYIANTTGYLGDINSTGQVVASSIGNATTLTLSATGGNFVATNVDLTTTGVKTVVLQRSVPVPGSPNRIDSITLKFNVTTAFNGSESAFTMNLNQMLNMVSTQQVYSNEAQFSFQVGTSTAATDTISTSIKSVTAMKLGLTGLDISTTEGSATASQALDIALELLSSQQANVGAVYNRLSAAASNLSVASENFQAARASLSETDIASEMPYYVGKQILTQTSMSMLAKSNETLSYILQLLR